jgi:hypothetical protein
MKRRLIVGVAAAALMTPSAVGAQGGSVPATTSPVAVPRTANEQAVPTVQGGRGGMIARAVETKITTGRPYAAEAVTETTQVLGDGTRISRRSATKVYRDGEGRTRREMLNDDGSIRIVTISDPVAHVNYTLDPRAKTAMKMTLNVVTPTYTMTTREGRTSTLTAAQGERRLAETAGGGGGAGARGGGGGTLMRTPAPDNPNVKKEDLAPQNVEGVMANGSRTTTVIPAGEIGNDKEIRIVSEQWFSDELQVLVLTRHSDPRSGDTVYRLSNILRAEPDPNLFTVPSDYTIEQRGGGGRGGRGGGQ